MRKLKLQMQITVDGFVAGPEGQLDWMTFDMDERLLACINELTDTSDTIRLGRKMTEGFIAIGTRRRVFSTRTPLRFVKSRSYASGIVVNTSAPKSS